MKKLPPTSQETSPIALQLFELDERYELYLFSGIIIVKCDSTSTSSYHTFIILGKPVIRTPAARAACSSQMLCIPMHNTVCTTLLMFLLSARRLCITYIDVD